MRPILLIGAVALSLVLGAAPAAATGPVALAPSAVAADRVGSAAEAAPAGGDPILIVAGDIAGCSYSADAKTADLVAGMPGTVMTAGDNVYPAGSLSQFNRCYGPTWGRFKDRTRPVLGNHDWMQAGAAGYFAYFGAAAGTKGQGWYAYDLGTWRIYALVGDCWHVGGCGTGSAQLAWLQADLAANPRSCILAVWHEPLLSTGPHGNASWVRPLFHALFLAGADVVVNGHDHMYERSVRIRPDLDPSPKGIREFVVGTGGAGRYGFARTSPLIAARDNTSYGVLRLTLHPDGYDWAFVPAAGSTYHDAGSAGC